MNNINYKASIIGILIMLALNEKTIGFFAYRLSRQSLWIKVTKFLPIESVETCL